MPNAISGICNPVQTQGTGTSEFATCNGLDWSVQSGQNAANVSMYIGQLFNDLGDNATGACNLANVSWVIPDGHWSDHPGNSPGSIVDGGPSWVAAIINAVGGVTNANTSITPPGKPPCNYWANTVVIVVWDDWGGWYDHVLPWRCDNTGTCSGYSNGTGPQYVYGFRVPMLVVSAYTPKAYISGAIGTQGENLPYVHDFGSILNFIEYVFGTGGNFLGGSAGIGDPNDPYADSLAPDGPNNPNCTQNPKQCPFGLSDFFGTPATGYFNPTSKRNFTFISGTNYTTDCFIHPQNHPTTCFGSNFAAMDPDNDATAP